MRQSLDWERALRRLDNSMRGCRTPPCGTNPKQAQAISREQEDAGNRGEYGQREISAEMSDGGRNSIAMGEAEGEDAIVV